MNVIPSVYDDPTKIQKDQRHLQRCITVLQKIMSIDPNSPSAALAQAAIENKPQSLGGSEYG